MILVTITLEHQDTLLGLSATIIQGFADLNQKLDGHHRKSVTQTADILESILEIREIKRNTGII